MLSAMGVAPGNFISLNPTDFPRGHNIWDNWLLLLGMSEELLGFAKGWADMRVSSMIVCSSKWAALASPPPK